MNSNLLTVGNDPMGAAIADYHTNKRAKKLQVFSSMFDEDEIPVKELFRTLKDMPAPEQKALRLAEGKILDVGGGSGCHSLALQDMGKDVCAIDISPLSVSVMQERGVRKVQQQNFFSNQFIGQFDTILLLMNGSGIIGKIEHLPEFFLKLKQLLSPNGFVLMDSSDLRYLFENEDGSFDIDLNADYYGEVDFRMQYADTKGDTFDWLYIDFQTLSLYAAESGFKVEMIQKGKHYDYLAKVSRS